MTKRLCSVMTALAVMMTLSACNQPLGGNTQSGAKSNVAMAKSEKPAEKKAPAAAKSTFDGGIILNGSFEDWTEKAPKEWNARIGMKNEWAGAPVTKSTDGEDGAYAVEMPLPPAGKVAALTQDIKAGSLVPGKEYTLSAMIKAPKEKELNLLLVYKLDGKEMEERVYTSGSGMWEKLEKKIVIPENVDPESFRLNIFRWPASKGKALVDMVSLK